MKSDSSFAVSNVPNATTHERDGSELPRFMHERCLPLFTRFCSSAYLSAKLGLVGVGRGELSGLKTELAEDETIKSSGLTVPELSTDLIQEIAKRCGTLRDFIACAEVSPLWRSACSEADWNRGPQPPSLMLSETAQSDTRSFLSLFHKRTNFELTLPAARGKRIWGSPRGWIVTLDDELQVHLLNLISQIQLQLPPLPTSETFHLVRSDCFRRLHKSLTFKISPTELLIAVITHQPNSLCFTRVPSGDVEWITVRNPNNFIFRDVAYLKGQVYALCENGSIVKIKFNEPFAAATHFLASGPEGETADRVYLVKSSDALFGIFRHGEDVADYGLAAEFAVYKFGMEGKMWEEKWSIGDSAFFVGNGNSWAVSSAARANCKKNSIYFTDDDWEQEKSLYLFGVYDMETWETDYQTMGSETGGDPGTQYSRPTWVAHGLTPTVFR
ncbi:hypothetical protein TIFTF001_041575 [Ficus carica]|uniref:KIB1-4 beta-propeller domain-containing protein n=1 Tax=Ficus carica TaxID=3494 RepID=A0AA87ZGG3_FICCA|nr:hypothetical protein TIFTF001_041575 [Ficus carica]